MTVAESEIVQLSQLAAVNYALYRKRQALKFPEKGDNEIHTVFFNGFFDIIACRRIRGKHLFAENIFTRAGLQQKCYTEKKRIAIESQKCYS